MLLENNTFLEKDGPVRAPAPKKSISPQEKTQT